jgi:Xaa-Pro aminopeptidase
MASHPTTARIAKLQATLSPAQGLLLSRRSDILYFSSFVANVPEERSAFLLITAEASHLLLQNFLPDPENFSGLVSHGFTSPAKLTEYLTELVKQKRFASLQADFSDLRVDEFQALQKILSLELGNLDRQPIWLLRSQKDPGELAKIKKARAVTRQVLQSTLAELRVGQSELEVARAIDQKIRAVAGCDLAFPSIIAFDEHSALPHHQPSHKKLRHGSVVLLDVGATFEHYCADMTRTIFWRQEGQVGSAKIKQKAEHFQKIEHLVKAAYKQAEQLLAGDAKLTAADLDLACRDFLTKAGYGKQFIHTTGHGLGLDIHEPPSLYRSNPQVLLPNMVITIEPGIYLPGQFGVRWENTVIC